MNIYVQGKYVKGSREKNSAYKPLYDPPSRNDPLVNKLYKDTKKTIKA